MINSDVLLTLAMTEMENPSFFPFPFPLHLGFSIIAFAFLIFRFVTNKKPYQLIMAIAISLSLVLHLPSATRTLYYIIGLIELILIIVALVTSYIFKDKINPETDKNAENDEVKE